MKRYLLLTALALATTAQADFWDNCTAYGGTIITANSYGNDKSGGLCNDPSNPELTNNCNGKRFCMSGNKMNWWSSFTWCESIGGRLASFFSMSPGAQTTPSGTCANLKSTGSSTYAWSNTLWQTAKPFRINLSTGKIAWDDTTWADHNVAFCEEN